MPTKRTGYELPCEVCGKMFYQRLSRINRTVHQFCSGECSRAYRQPLSERFWSKVDRSGDADACWPWVSRSKLPFGYGHMMVGERGNRTMVRAHRFAFELAYGPIPEGFYVLHTCDNPGCVRNDDVGFYELNGILHPRRGHLWLGTLADNTADMIAKGRGGSQVYPDRLPHGEAHHFAKLTTEDIHVIRARYSDGETNLAAIAREYGVSRPSIESIIRHVTWKHIE